jgi:hypothetical protein
MDHPVTVRAEQRQVGQPGLGFARDVQWGAVVAFDVVESMGAVRVTEIEGAHFASDREPASFGVRELASLPVSSSRIRTAIACIPAGSAMKSSSTCLSSRLPLLGAPRYAG